MFNENARRDEIFGLFDIVIVTDRKQVIAYTRNDLFL